MRIVLLPALLILLAPLASADVVDEVRCREVGFSLAAEKQDAEAFRSFIDADARFAGNSVLQGVDAIADAWTYFFRKDGPTIKWRPRIVEVLEDGKLALTRGPYRVVSSDANGNRTEQWGTFNSVWRLNDDGTWRVVFDAGNEAATEPDETTKALLDAATDCP
jgi:ketosteroid isomerase-like protein